jgi:hypothetical protein
LVQGQGSFNYDQQSSTMDTFGGSSCKVQVSVLGPTLAWQPPGPLR